MGGERKEREALLCWRSVITRRWDFRRELEKTARIKRNLQRNHCKGKGRRKRGRCSQIELEDLETNRQVEWMNRPSKGWKILTGFTSVWRECWPYQSASGTSYLPPFLHGSQVVQCRSSVRMQCGSLSKFSPRQLQQQSASRHIKVGEEVTEVHFAEQWLVYFILPPKYTWKYACLFDWYRVFLNYTTLHYKPAPCFNVKYIPKAESKLESIKTENIFF